jgi:site-specific DNA-methyltransferase (cytosine-N4-specific)
VIELIQSIGDMAAMKVKRSRPESIPGFIPMYRTKLGEAYCGPAEVLLAALPDSSIDLIMTSPPFALRKKKEYGNVEPERYVDWFHEFAVHFHRVLKNDGSLVIHIGGSWERGRPTRSLYQYRLLLDLCEPKADRLRVCRAEYSTMAAWA